MVMPVARRAYQEIRTTSKKQERNERMVLRPPLLAPNRRGFNVLFEAPLTGPVSPNWVARPGSLELTRSSQFSLLTQHSIWSHFLNST